MGKPYKNYEEEVPIEEKRLVQEQSPINQREQEAQLPHNKNKEGVKVTNTIYNEEVSSQNQETLGSHPGKNDMDMWDLPWWLL